MSSEVPSEVSNYVKKGSITIKHAENVIYRTACWCTFTKGQFAGESIFTKNSLIFVQKGNNGWVIEIQWQQILKMTLEQKRYNDKGITFELDNNNSIFLSAMKDRDVFWSYVLLLTNAVKNKKSSYGFIAKDDAEVLKRLTILRAPHTMEELMPAHFSEVYKLLKTSDLWIDAMTMCGSKDIIVSRWQKIQDGVTRIIQFTHPMFQMTNISLVQKMMKSGKTSSLECFYTLSRILAQNFLQIPLQYFIQRDHKSLQFRCAYSLDWITETWDKEFVEEAMNRIFLMNFNYFKSKIMNKEFDRSSFEGQWKKHQPFVLVIVALILLILTLIISPDDVNWYKFCAGLVSLFIFFII